MHNLQAQSVLHISTCIIHSTIRHAECELLVIPDENSGQRCNRCTAYRSNLRALLSRHVKHDTDASRTDPSSHASFSRLSSPEKCIRYHQEHELQRACQRQVTNLRMKLQSVTRREAYLWTVVYTMIWYRLCRTMLRQSVKPIHLVPLDVIWRNEQSPKL